MNFPSADRKLKVLVITMGGERQELIREMFSQPEMESHFLPPEFSPGIPSRDLRSRRDFFHHANEAHLLPRAEFEAIQGAHDNPEYQAHPEKFFECLENVPISENRKGSDFDKSLHYSVELWKKARTVNRGRSVLACSLAHLIAIRRLVDEGFDLILEDNVRAPLGSCAQRIRDTIMAVRESDEMSRSMGLPTCHMCCFGWLGSLVNLKWITDIHAPKRKYKRMDGDSIPSVFAFPTQANLDEDLAEMDHSKVENSTTSSDTGPAGKQQPGGAPLWGAYAYWISREGYRNILNALQSDVGAMLWKSKRQRYYAVKPIDKILPRLIRLTCGEGATQVTTHPAFFRAPMLTSKIHSQWDPEFCKSTEFQLSQCGGLDWNSLWLSSVERHIVDYRKETGTWATPMALAAALKKEGNDQVQEYQT